MSPGPRHSQRGSLLVAALLLFSLLIALGLGLMSSQSARMRVAQAQVKSIQAKALCDAAWEDVRVKLGKDILFPLPVDGQTFFAYSEDVYAPQGGVEKVVGSYSVVVDIKLNRSLRETDDLEDDVDVAIPEGIYQVTCIGKVGARDNVPEAERVIVYEIVMADPDTPTSSFRVIRIEDKGAI